MATLRMATPWRDPRTGKFYARIRVPKHLQAAAGHAIYKRSLDTSDPAEARKVWPKALAEFEAQKREWERLGAEITITPERARAVAAEWAAWVAATNPLVVDGDASDIFEPMMLREAQTPAAMARMMEVVERHTEEALRLVGISVTPESRPILLGAMTSVVACAYLEADQRSLGLAGSSPVVNPLSEIRSVLPNPIKTHRATPRVPLGDLFEGYKRVATAGPATMREAEYALRALIAFAGTDDATEIDKAMMVRWRDAMKADGKSNATWNNRRSLLTGMFDLAVQEGRLSVNPLDGLRLRLGRGEQRYPYTDEEAARILTMARAEARPSRRWAHWMMAFTGMRVGEALQMDAADIRVENGIWYFAIVDEPPLKSVKNSLPRNVPVHPALIAEGFLDYVQSLPEGSPLFPDKRPDTLGRRGGGGWVVVGRWVRDTVGIADARKAPNHSWRHRVEDELRNAGVDESIRDAIVGHVRKTTGRRYGVRGESLARLAEAVAKIPVPPSVAPGNATGRAA